MRKILLVAVAVFSAGTVLFPATVPVTGWKAWAGPADSLKVSATAVNWGAGPDSLANALLSGCLPAIALADGESLAVSGVLTLGGVDKAPSHQFRFGIFQRGKNDSPNGWLGYVSTSASPEEPGFILARAPGNKIAFQGAGGPGEAATRNIFSSKLTSRPLRSGVYKFQMILARADRSLRVKVGLAEESGTPLYTQETVDTEPATFTFDQVGFSFGPVIAVDSLVFQQMKVETGTAGR